jgi:hypothetical protein
VKIAKGTFFLVFIRESEVREMTHTFTKSLSIAAAITLCALMVAPAQAADPVVPVATATAETGTITVISRVLNDNLGTKTANDFEFSIMHWGTPIAGVPFTGAGNTGISFNLPAGTYVVSTPIIEGYNGVWFGEGITNGFIDLKAGQNITIARLSDDAGLADGVVVPVTPPTEDGGTLPATSSPWFNALAAALLVSTVGIFGLRSSLKVN